LGNEVNCQEKEGTMLKPLEIPPLTAEELEALEKLYRTTKQRVEKLQVVGGKKIRSRSTCR
jgi:hypothetical protein